MSLLLLLHPGHLDDPFTLVQFVWSVWPVVVGWAVAILVNLRRRVCAARKDETSAT